MITYSHPKALVALCLMVFATWLLPVLAQAQCTSGCNISQSISGTVNSTFNILSNNQTICLTGSGTYNGTINCHNNSGITVCIGPGVTFSSSANIQNATGGTNVNNFGTFQQSNYTIANGRTFTNNTGGVVNSALTVSSGSTFNNAGTFSSNSFNMSGGTVSNTGSFTLSGSFNPSGSGSWSGGGSITLSGGASINSGTFNFQGSTTIAGNFSLATGPSVTFAGPTIISGHVNVNSGSTLNVASSIAVTGNITNTGTITVPSSATSCVSLCPNGNINNSGGTLTTASGKTMSLCKAPSPAGTQGANVSVVTNPSTQPTNLSLSVGTSNIIGTFDAAASSPQGYIIVRQINADLASQDYPVYGRTYTVGETIGSARVVAINNASTTTFADNISTCGTYYYAILNMSNGTATCAGYNVSSPLKRNTTNLVSVGGTITGGSTLCAGDTPPTLSVSGQTGGIVKWQRATNTAFTANLADISHTGTSYTPPSTPSQTTYYRAVVQLGSCATQNANYTTVSIMTDPSVTTWTGSTNTSSNVCNNWSLGKPITTTNVTINGTATTPTLNEDLTVNNLSFGASNPATASLDLNGRTLTINGTLTLGTSSALSVNNGTLVINGSISGSGTLTGGSTANISIGGSGTFGNLTLGSNTTINNLTINRSGQVINLNSNLTVNGALTITNGTLSVGANRLLTLNGNVNISQPIRVTGSSELSIGGSGTISNSLIFESGYRQINNLRMNRANTTLTLGSNLEVFWNCNITAGTLAVGSNTLSISGFADFTGGKIAVTSASNIMMGGGGSPPVFTFESGSNTINNFSSTKTGTTTLGSNLTVLGTLTIPSLAIGNNTLTVSGPIATSTTFRGSTSSNLLINGTGAISSFAFESGQANLNNLIISRSGTLALGSSLAVNGTFSTTNSAITSIGSNSLTLSGAISTPSLAGTTTSNLFITGSGTIDNLTFVSGSRNLNNLTINRANANVTLANDLTINGLMTLTSGDLNINGNTLTLSGTATGSGLLRGSSTSNLSITGTGDLGTIQFRTANAVLNNLTLNRTSTGIATLNSDLQINGNLTFNNGILISGTNIITLSSTGAVVNENASSYLRGKLSVSRTVAQNVTATFSGTGIEIRATGAAPGITTVVRNTYTPSIGNGNQGIRLTYTITPTFNTGLNAQLKFKYFNDSWGLNGRSGNKLCFWRSTDGGIVWSKRGYTTKDLGTNQYTLDGVDSFSDWTLGDPQASPLPVELLNFYGKATKDQVNLYWSTASERNNAGYKIEQSEDQITWKSIGFIVGNENSSTLQQHNWSGNTDVKSAYYRIVQSDLDGTSKVYSAIYLTSTYEGDISLNTYPNPTTDVLNISYHTLYDTKADLNLVNQLGQVMMSQEAQLLSGSGLQSIDMRTLPPGIYILKAVLQDGAKAQSWRITKQ